MIATDTNIVLSDDQQRALGRILRWYEDGKLTLTLGGYAGTGKTTLLGQLQYHLPVGTRIHFCSYTGKAVSVLASKLPPGATVTTLHRLLYKPRKNYVCTESKEIVPILGGWCDKHHSMNSDAKPRDPCPATKQLDWSPNPNPLDGIDLVVVDEASMISDKIWSDLTRWGVPVLAVGDHGQLPPIKSTFNLMADPEIKLEKILRQAEGSPIIRMASMARMYGELPYKDFGDNCRVIPTHELHKYEIDPNAGDLIIAAYNRTRNGLNESMRGQLGFSGLPTEGDIVICLRNSYEHGVFNGMRGRIRSLEPFPYGNEGYAEIEMLDEGFDYSGLIDLRQFGEPKTLSDTPRHLGLFDFGYCMTAHKAQGSQADRVVVINERLPQTNHRRWLYTAVTRAAKELIVVGK